MKSLHPSAIRTRQAVVLFCGTLSGIALFAGLSYAAAHSETGTVTIKDDVIIIRPGTQLKEPDRKKLNETLSHYDKSLYKVETYKHGKLLRTLGELSDVLIDKALVAEAAEAAAKGNSSRTLQIIAATSSQQLFAGATSAEAPDASPSASTNPQRIKGPTPTATPPPNAAPSASTNPQRIKVPTPTATPPPNAEPSASTNPQRIPRGTPTPAPSAMPSASTNPQRHPSGTPTPAPSAMPSASTNPQHHPSGTPTPVPNAPTNPQRVTAADEKAGRELIERLKPILEKAQQIARRREAIERILRRRYFWLAWFVIHFALLVGICAQQTLWILAQGYTGLPHWLDPYWRKAAELTTTALGQNLRLSNQVRESLTSYLHATGVESGYGYFAPNVPSSYKLVFELYYADGHAEYDLPRVSGSATGLRLVSLLDRIGRTDYEPLREVMLKMLAYSAWQQHPGVVTVRTVFGYVDVPSVEEVKAGKTETYTFLYAYDFTFPSPHPDLPAP